MKEEVEAAAQCIASFTNGLSPKQKEDFNAMLKDALSSKYKDHWFPDKPLRGTGYRSIQVNARGVDSVLTKVARDCGVTDLCNLFPGDLTVWVDPHEVSYRIGEEGSIGVYFERKPVQPTHVQPTHVQLSRVQPTPISSTADFSISRSCRFEAQQPSSVKQEKNYYLVNQPHYNWPVCV